MPIKYNQIILIEQTAITTSKAPEPERFRYLNIINRDESCWGTHCSLDIPFCVKCLLCLIFPVSCESSVVQTWMIRHCGMLTALALWRPANSLPCTNSNKKNSSISVLGGTTKTMSACVPDWAAADARWSSSSFYFFSVPWNLAHWLSLNVRNVGIRHITRSCSDFSVYSLLHKPADSTSSAAWPQPPVWICVYGSPGKAENDTYIIRYT